MPTMTSIVVIGIFLKTMFYFVGKYKNKTPQYKILFLVFTTKFYIVYEFKTK